jgi:hypothetical protein
VAVSSFVLAFALQLVIELVVQRKSVKNKKRKLMKTKKYGQNVGKTAWVVMAVMKIMAGVSTGICGRCLLP